MKWSKSTLEMSIISAEKKKLSITSKAKSQDWSMLYYFKMKKINLMEVVFLLLTASNLLKIWLSFRRKNQWKRSQFFFRECLRFPHRSYQRKWQNHEFKLKIKKNTTSTRIIINPRPLISIIIIIFLNMWTCKRAQRRYK